MNWPYSGKDGLIEQVYLPIFHLRGEDAIRIFHEMTIARKGFLNQYRFLPSLEEMTEHDKREPKRYVIEKFPDKSSAEKLEICKIIHVIGNLV